jgi:hypothetical protein
MLGYTFHTIDLIYPQRGVYISSLIQPEQILYIQNSINKMNLTRTYFKESNHIRIQYDNDIIANTKMSATLYQIGSFVVENTVISFNPNIYENVLGCVMLHELGHSVGLGHNNIMGSIMNFTLFINAYGYILNNNDECELSDDDINGINYFV